MTTTPSHQTQGTLRGFVGDAGTFDEHKSSSQRCRNCFSYGKFAFTFLPVNEINPEHSFPQSAARCTPKCQWLLDFFIQSEQTPRREKGGIWHELIDRVPLRGLIRPGLQLPRFTTAVGFDLRRDYSHSDVCTKKGAAPRRDLLSVWLACSPLLTHLAPTARVLSPFPQPLEMNGYYRYLTFTFTDCCLCATPLAIKKRVTPGG